MAVDKNDVYFGVTATLTVVGILVIAISANRIRAQEKRSLGMLMFLIIAVVGVFGGLVFLIMSSRKEIECPGCMASGLFVKCRPGTGSDSRQCADFRAFRKRMNELIAEIEAVGELATRIGNMVSSGSEAVRDAVADLAAKIDAISIPSVPIPTIPNLKRWSCKIPVIKFDVCKGIADGVNGSIIGPFRSALNAAGQAVRKTTEAIPKVITVPAKKIAEEFAEIGREISQLVAKVRVDLDAITAIYDNFEGLIKQANVSELVFAYITESISGVFGSASKFVVAAIVSGFLIFGLSLVSMIVAPVLSLISLVSGV